MSDKVALFYTGNDEGEPHVSGVPARDLTDEDIARLVYIEGGGKNAEGKLIDRLTAGPYRKTKPDAPAHSTPAAAPAAEE